MQHDGDRRALAGEAAQRVERRVGAAQVEMTRRFVEEHRRRALRECRRDPYALALAGGERVEHAAGKRYEFHAFDCRVDDRVVLRQRVPAPPRPMREPPHRDRIAHHDIAVGAVFRRDERHGPRASGRREGVHRHVAGQHAAALRREHAGKRAQQRGFPRTVRPDDRDQLAAAQRNAHVAQHDALAVSEREAARLDHTACRRRNAM